MPEQYVLQTALFREIAETAHTTLELISKPTTSHLERLRTIRDDLDRIEAGLVAVLREDGATWESLALAAGVTRQSMYERLKNRAPRWVESVRRTSAGDDAALRRSLQPAWERITSELSLRAMTLINLDVDGQTNLGPLAPVPAFKSTPIDVARRTSPSRTPR